MPAKKTKTEARPGRSGKVLEQTAVCVAQRPEGRPVRAGKILEASIPRRGRAVETHASPPLRKNAPAAPFRILKGVTPLQRNPL